MARRDLNEWKGACPVCGRPTGGGAEFSGSLCSGECSDKYQRLHNEGRVYKPLGRPRLERRQRGQA